MEEKQLKAICDPTRLKILGLLAEETLTNTELHKKLEEVTYRESVFKGFAKLRQAGLIKREFKEKVGYKYSLNFKQLKISNRMLIKAKGMRKASTHRFLIVFITN